MEFLNFIGAVSGCSSIVAFLAVIVKLGEWKARHEERVSTHEKRLVAVEHKQDNLSLLLHKNNEILAEIKVKLDMSVSQKSKRSKV